MSTSPETGGGREAPISIVSLARRPWTGSTPTPLMPLIGRVEERARVRELIDGGVRLLTLHGPGGIGKTRLAIQLALELQDGFPDGIAWVPLATVRDAPAVLPAIAKTIGIDESPTQSALLVLRNALREGRHLLILDNVEQVLDVGSQLAELLSACPNLVVLAMSRSLLSLQSGAWQSEVNRVQPI
jgi:predicted ATPase